MAAGTQRRAPRQSVIATGSHCASPSAFQDRGHSHAAGSAYRNEAAFSVGVICEQLREGCDDAGAGGGEGMPERNAAAFYIEPRTIDGAQGGSPGNRAILARTRDFLSLAGTVRVPAAKRNVVWDDVIRSTRLARATKRR